VEHDQLSSRHEQLLQESEGAQEDLQRQLRAEEGRHSSQRQEQAELISQLRQEIEDITNAFKNQLHSLQQDHHKVSREIFCSF
jgi:chromosome segregation ATPase